MNDGFIRVAAATPRVKVADCAYNADSIISHIKSAATDGASLIVFPELCVTGYTCEDLFLQPTLLSGAESALAAILFAAENLDIVAVVGVPVRCGAALYNCGVVLYKGKILGAVPKHNIPNYGEFYEARHFSSGSGVCATVTLCGQEVTLSSSQIFTCKDFEDFSFGVEVCEDLWVTAPPSNELCVNGALLICNISASNEVIGKADYRRSLVATQSARAVCGYIYANAGEGESSTDLVFAGGNLIAENGVRLAEGKRFTTGITNADIDLARLSYERRRMNTFTASNSIKPTLFSLPIRELTLCRNFPPLPFVPSEKERLTARCEEILAIQSAGLATRLKHTGTKSVVLGLSGGLDSTLALIVITRAFDALKLDRGGIIAVTLPCFGTTSRTKNNAIELANAYGVTLKEVDITAAVNEHFRNIGQDPEKHDVAYENAQARERTQVLMDIANMGGALVIGTCDLSETALGWSTYNGDHMSMYGVNASIPKTLVRHLVAFEGDCSGGALKAVLYDVLATPVSPELLPPDGDGEISQKTEELVGPYELHDFFLYYFLRFGYPPQKILRIAMVAFAEQYDGDMIKKWLKVFIKRFFANQFKRSCSPDGVKVGTVSLSPRGDLRMPSDAVAAQWLKF